ncbi:MAG: phosphoribosylamine--glycine ligase [Rothia sp. (in: high G+C Gram-positive bacteria)]|nr:phosphoribosylamine--glycine ligase [Rothia sp. (in: high G+C Gram-positive bacteria)]
MKVLVLGSGGREHAIIRALGADPKVSQVYSAPGNAGIAQVVPTFSLDVQDGEQTLALARQLEVDLVVIGPEAPLVAGVADVLRAGGFAVFGPDRAAAALEGSKAFAKEIMAAAQVPTAMALLASDLEQANQALDKLGPPYVVKDDGLAAGKGVVVTQDRQQALAHAQACFQAGSSVLIEEFLAGPEVSLFVLSDGHRVLPLAPAQDFKRIFDGDTGPNTGGMGAYSPLPWLPEGFVQEVVDRVALPTIQELARRGKPFVGLLYCGLILTARGMRVIEFNARFGDPETQVVLARLQTPLGQLLLDTARGDLDSTRPLRWDSRVALDVVMAAAGYPGKVEQGQPINGLDKAAQGEGVHLIHAGTVQQADRTLTAGGRVLAVVGLGQDLHQARERVYAALSQISWPGAQYRTDIALAAAQNRIVLPGSQP